MEAVSSVLQSSIVDKYGKPFAQRTQKIVEQLDVTVEKQEIVIEKQDEIGKATKKVMRNFEVEMGGAFARSSDGIKELTGGFLDIKDIIETVGKKFSALGDVIAPISEIVSGVASGADFLDRFKKDKTGKIKEELPSYLQEGFVGPVTKKQQAEQKKQRKKESLSRIFGAVKFATFIAAGIGIFILLKKFIQSGFFAGMQDLVYNITTGFDKMMMLFVNDERKKVIQKRINERDINYAETMFNRKRESGPVFRKQLENAKSQEEKNALLGNILSGVGVPLTDGKPNDVGKEVLKYVADRYNLNYTELLDSFTKETGEYIDKLEKGQVETTIGKKTTSIDGGTVSANLIKTDTTTDEQMTGIMAQSQNVSTKTTYDDYGSGIYEAGPGFKGYIYLPKKKKSDAMIDKDLLAEGNKRDQKLLRDNLLSTYAELRAFADANGLGYVLDMMEGEHVKGGKTIRANAYFGPDGHNDMIDTLELMNAEFLKGKSLAELQTLLGDKQSIADSNIEAKEKAFGDQLKLMQDNALMYGTAGPGGMSMMPITNFNTHNIQNLTGSQNTTNDEGLNSSTN